MAQQIRNEDARALVFKLGRRKTIELPAQAITGNETINLELPKMGIGLYVDLRIDGTISRVCPAAEDDPAPALSYNGPYAMIDRVDYKDYSGITRISAGGPLLHAREVTTKQNYDPGNMETLHDDSQLALLYQFALPTYEAAATKTADFSMTLEIPFTPSRYSTQGTIPFNVPNGVNMLSIRLANIVGTTHDFPVKVKAGTESEWSFSGTLYATYYCIDCPLGTPMPQDDFSVVFELVQLYDQSNMAANAQHATVLETGRTYRGVYQLVYDAGVPSIMRVDRLKFLVDASTPYFDMWLASYVKENRRNFNRDLPPGVLCFRFDENTLNPNDYGELRLESILGSAFGSTGGGTSRILTLRETLYRVG